MIYSELQELIRQIKTPDDLVALNMLLEHHTIAHQTWIYELSTEETKT